MPTSKEYLLYVHKGEAISEERRKNMLRLGGQNLYVKGDPVFPSTAPSLAPTQEFQFPRVAFPSGPAFEGETLSEEAGAALKDAFRDLINIGTNEGRRVSEVVVKMADEILAVVAPEVADLRKTVLANLNNLTFMNDTGAIISLAVMVSLANDFKSKTAFQNLCHAALLMDAALADLTETELETYYRNRGQLPTHVREKVNLHPVRSQQLVAYMPLASDTVNQLILVHHELHNGQGYHRGIRTENISGLGRALCFAVDIFEFLRNFELNSIPTDVKSVVLLLEERGVEPHARRHNSRLVKNVRDFLGI